MSRTRKPVVEGWTRGEGREFVLLGTECRDCAAVFFPREDRFCRNPRCQGTSLHERPLSRRGRVWSCTDGRYRPPAPYVSDPDAEWEPRVLIAAELAAEGMVVLGQAPPGTRTCDVFIGMEVELVPGVLDGEDGREWTTWNWKPLEAGA